MLKRPSQPGIRLAFLVAHLADVLALIARNEELGEHAWMSLILQPPLTLPSPRKRLILIHSKRKARKLA